MCFNSAIYNSAIFIARKQERLKNVPINFKPVRFLLKKISQVSLWGRFGINEYPSGDCIHIVNLNCSFLPIAGWLAQFQIHSARPNSWRESVRFEKASFPANVKNAYFKLAWINSSEMNYSSSWFQHPLVVSVASEPTNPLLSAESLKTILL